MSRLSRRGLLFGACSAAAVVAAGCGRPTALLQAFGVQTHLRLELLGLPSAAVRQVTPLLQVCAAAYRAKGRGLIALDISDSPIPDTNWYQPCSPGQCPPPPAEAVQVASALQLFNPAAVGQLGMGGVPKFLVRGRTRLGVRFGTGGLVPPEPAGAAATGPDIVVAYDLWQYWLAPLATDIAATWKLDSGDRVGLSSTFDRYGKFFTAARGTFLATFPVLRNPMVLWGVSTLGAVDPWDWNHVVGGIAHWGPRIDTASFVQDDLYPQATEAACALVAAYGGTVGQAGPSATAARFTQPAGVRALTALASIIAAGSRQPVSAAGLPLLVPDYLQPALWGMRGGYAPNRWAIQPLPAGPARSATPCTYLCATVFATGAHAAIAEDFCSSLQSQPAQTILAGWRGACRCGRMTPRR